MKMLIMGLAGLFFRSPEGDGGGGDPGPVIGEAQMNGDVSPEAAPKENFLQEIEGEVENFAAKVEKEVEKPLSVVEELLHRGSDAKPLVSSAVHNCSDLITELDELIETAKTGLSASLVVPGLENTRAEILAHLKNLL